MTVHDDMADVEYFAHPALSHSDTKLILDSPAKYRWLKDHPDRPYRAEFEFGHVVHELALGRGAGITIVDADDWRTKAAKEARSVALEEGTAPVLRHEYDTARAAVDSLMRHPLAGKLLGHLDHAEAAAFWDDGDVLRKAKLDGVCGRFGIDVKTTVNASTEAFGRTAGTFAYYSQDAWYRDALCDAFGIADPKFLFVVVEKYPPHLVNVIELDPYAVELGTKRNRRAIDLYRQCRDNNDWPSYGDGINQAQLPRWAEIQEETAA